MKYEVNHVTVRLDPSVASRGMKTYSENRIELRNQQRLYRMLEMSSQSVSSEPPCELKNLNVALNIGGVEKYTWKTCGQH